MGSTNTASPIRYLPRDPELVAERKRVFLAELAAHGIFRYAAAKASGHVVARNGYGHDTNCGEEFFRKLIKHDPEFAERVAQARSVAVGNLEKKLADRIDTPNRRPIFDKAGNLLGEDVNWRDANVLLLRALERNDPNWVQRKQIDGTTHVVHSDAEVGSGASYVLKPADMLLLPPDKRGLLIQLLEDIEAARDVQEPVLSPAAPAALPRLTPEGEHGLAQDTAP